jgi:hypothetical protein
MNRKWEDINMEKHIITSTGVSRVNMLADTKNEIFVAQKETSQGIQKLNTEYNEMSREYDKRNKLLKEDEKVKEKIKVLKYQEWEQERKLQGYVK